ncbi:MAG TPA: flagellar basal-body rod protein FlgG [Planctomycetota bacterium]|jgi:flagellar basal-body rod protein FlgG|nr:flagellar basal-body rod protein FlgG [Planctomycetota bacterium]
MLRALSIAATGGSALMNQIDTIANNLANVNTTAFKKTRANFADLFYQEIQRAGFGEPGRSQSPTGTNFGTGVRLASTEKLFSQGTLQSTGRNLDLAIDGEGFFRVVLPDSTIAFTRAGNLNVDSQGNLVTSDGFRIDPQITISQNFTAITVDQTGLIQGLDPQQPQQLQSIGQLNITRFINPSGLAASGQNLYLQTPAAGNRIDGQPSVGQGMGAIRQGFLEQSNVDVIQELVDLITAQRAFEMNSKSIQTADDILQTVNNLKR